MPRRKVSVEKELSPQGQRRKVKIEKQIPTEEKGLHLSEGEALFKSDFPGFKQVLQPGRTNHFPNGDMELIPPKVAEFVNGTFRTSDAEEIELLRGKIALKERKGRRKDFVEITGEAKKRLDEGREVTPIVGEAPPPLAARPL